MKKSRFTEEQIVFVLSFNFLIKKMDPTLEVVKETIEFHNYSTHTGA